MNDFAQQVKTLLGIRLTAAQVNALEIYERELLDWNSRFNLTAIQETEKIRTKHFLDSLTCLSVMHNPAMERVIDVGTGAGFPGLPLKIVSPNIRLTLVESVGKKASFCRHVAMILGLGQVEIIQERAELVGQMPAHRQMYDWALGRAVAVLPVLAEYLLPLARVGGAAIAMKGENAPAEAQSAERAIHVLGGHLRKLVPVTLPGVADERYLVVIDKVAATPPAYPRRVGLPTRHPL